MKLWFLAALLSLVVFTTGFAAENTRVRVIALFANKALLEIGSQQKLLSRGEQFKGVTLKSASSRGAIVLINGKERKLGLNQSITSDFKKPERGKSTVYPDSQGMYYVDGKINGRPMHFLIDTGATYIAMSGQHAAALGIDYRKGVRGLANTASGTVQVWQVTLNSVSIGGISAPNVEASIIQGSRPYDVLLGNSFLKFVNLQRQGAALVLEQKY